MVTVNNSARSVTVQRLAAEDEDLADAGALKASISVLFGVRVEGSAVQVLGVLEDNIDWLDILVSDGRFLAVQIPQAIETSQHDAWPRVKLPGLIPRRDVAPSALARYVRTPMVESTSSHDPSTEAPSDQQYSNRASDLMDARSASSLGRWVRQSGSGTSMRWEVLVAY